ncbi:alpha/beta fold hydrolase [Mycetocola saprophilus]|uniref:alpha/beta fold hydrolase n=1 Tax=Mycetocola saprophilus TaxID=76636 RepID=UPI00138DF7F7|nr:alpha/beta hydrolase [Mycetocola saprophilus]
MVAAAGYSATSGENGGPQTWGNLASLRGVDAHNALGQALPNVKTGKTALISGSMGGLISMNWAAANPDKVSCIVSVIPVCNVTDIVTNDREGYAQFANSAYTGGWSESAYGAGHNPFTLSQAGKLAGIPMLFFYGLTDKLCIPTWPEQMKRHAGNNITLVPLQSGHDYDSYAAVNQPMIVDFLNTHNV